MHARLVPGTTLVLIIDVQQRLAAAMPESRLNDLVRAASIVLGAAASLDVPVLASEQYPKGLGPMVPEVERLLERTTATRVEKTCFSIADAAGFDAALAAANPRAVVILGIEAHVCVYQSVRDTVARGIPTYVVSDGVCSRREDHREVGLSLCESAGAVLTTAESVVFDWLADSMHPAFKAVSQSLK